MEYYNTVDTTRIPYDNAAEMAVEVTRMVWPAAPSVGSPRVIILVPDNVFQYGFMAASLIHDPINGTLLMTSPDELYSVTREEIVRINPQGTREVPPIIMVGPFRPKVVRDVEKMGYEVLQVRGKNVFETAANVARLRAQFPPESPEGPISLFIISDEQPYEGMPVPYYSAHSGVPILLTQSKRLTPSTARVLKDMCDKNVYVVGGRRSVADKVLNEIAAIVRPPVRRIAGSNPFGTAVEFAQYRDPVTGLGWNRSKKGRGDAFTFANVENWELAAAATALAHQGKHTPLLVVGREEVPAVVLNYLEFLKPPLKMPVRPPFMHGFVLGSYEAVSREVQVQLELALKIDVQPVHHE